MRLSLFIWTALVFVGPPAGARVWYVNQNAAGPVHDGSSWTSGFVHAADGLAGAASGDEVWVAAGTYVENVTVGSGIALYGGFGGTETSREQRTGTSGVTTLDGGMKDAVVTVASGASAGTVVDGFTIRNGLVGMAMSSAAATVSHNVITMNGTTQGLAGGIYSVNGSPRIVNNFVLQNAAQAAGGIYCTGSPVIANNTIAGNACTTGPTGIGSSVFCAGSAGLVENNIIAFNYSGFARSASTPPTVRSNCIYGNNGEDFLYLPAVTGVNGNISVDPLFAGFSYGNLHIQPNSPCRDAGDNTAVAAGDTDIDLLPRIVGGRVDIGADESDGRTWDVQPAVVRVSPMGSDANDGSSWPLAKATIQSAIDAAVATGGEVWVEAGVYPSPAPATPAVTGGFLLPPSVYLYGGFGGTESARDDRDISGNATMLAGNGKGPVVVATGGYRNSGVDGFVITKDGGSSAGVGGVFAPSASPLIMNNDFTANMVGVNSGGSPYIANNSFVQASIEAVSCVSGRPVIAKNLFENNKPSAMLLSLGQSWSVIEGNVIRDNTMPQGGGLMYDGGNQTIVNNTFVRNTTGSILSVGASNYMTCVNNIIAFNTGGAALTASGTVRNNCFYQSSVPTQVIGKSGNFYANPGFVNWGLDDDHLTDTSPCVDAGDDSVAVPGDVDIDGHPRLQGHHVDIGAYESAASSSEATYPDIPGILLRAGGVVPASPSDLYMNGDDTGGSHGVIDIADAVVVARRIVGLGTP